MDHPARRLNNSEINELKNLLEGFEEALILSNELKNQKKDTV